MKSLSKGLIILVLCWIALPTIAQRIYIDPGHFVGDARTDLEIETNLAVGLKLKKLLAMEERWEISMSRENGKVNVSLADRVKDANESNADLLISIHCNAGGGTGTETFWCDHKIGGSFDPDGEKSKGFAQLVQKHMVDRGKWDNRRVVEDSSYLRDRNGNPYHLYILRNSQAPACLNEIGFVDHDEDSKKLADDEWREKFALAYRDAIYEYFGGQQPGIDDPADTDLDIPTLTHTAPVLIEGLREGPTRRSIKGIKERLECGNTAHLKRVPDLGGNAFIILKQYDNNCGPTSVQMVLHYYGKMEKLEDVHRTGGIETVAIGTRPNQLRNALNNLGVNATWYEDTNMPNADPYRYLRSCIDENRPPIILLELGNKAYHWVVVVGYDDAKPLRHYLIADPNGHFDWYSRLDLDIKWSFKLEDPVIPDFKAIGAFVVDTFTSIGSGPYTMIVPDEPPTSHLPGYWSEMKGEHISGDRRLNVFGRTKTWSREFKFNPFDLYNVSAVRILTSGTVADLTAHSKIKNSVKLEGLIQDGLFTPGQMWVVVRTYSSSPPTDRALVLFSISGDNQTAFQGKELAEPLVVEVQDQDGNVVQGASVTFKVTKGDGSFSAKTSSKTAIKITDKGGRAQIKLKLGTDPAYTVTATASTTGADMSSVASFNAAWNLNINQDAVFDINDLAFVLDHFGLTITIDTCPNPDVDGSGTVDEKDFLLVSDALLEQAKAGSPAPAAYTHTIPGLTAKTVQKWILSVEQRAQGDPRFDGGIALLKQLLASIRPDKTLLLANYPNPFNPETWIPYQLAETGDVSITIYAINGQVIRTLNLGVMPTGTYQSRESAAYWDGRNAVGERVASGLYFYTLTTGEFSATRRMLILK